MSSIQAQATRAHLKNKAIPALLISGLAIRAFWAWYTGFMAEDAFITFRYAWQLAAGHGFVHNIGEKVYGTTTPLLTLLLAAWRWLTGSEIPAGATILNLVASATMLVFIWLVLRSLGSSPAQRMIVMGGLSISARAIALETQGMETVWVILFMAAAWWAWLEKRPILTGISCGLLLWTRIDTFLWPLALALMDARKNWRNAARILLISLATYAPWLIFSSLYFGSPIPHTITAKWVAYIQFNREPILGQIPIILNYLTPFPFDSQILKVNYLAWLTIAMGLFFSLCAVKDRNYAVLSVFALLEMLWLTMTRGTLFVRYLYPLWWTFIILFGLGMGYLWDSFSRKQRSARLLLSASLGILLALDLFTLGSNATNTRYLQTYQHNASLKAMGLWLNQNTPREATVLLEPLGYVGYYADRRMIDEVGLISPKIVELKRQKIDDVYEYVQLFKPDYVITPCDEADNWKTRSETGEIHFTSDYAPAALFNPLNFSFQSGTDFDPLARSICYEIWRQK